MFCDDNCEHSSYIATCNLTPQMLRLTLPRLRNGVKYSLDSICFCGFHCNSDKKKLLMFLSSTLTTEMKEKTMRKDKDEMFMRNR
jgi:hypothetical protein